MDKIGLDAVIFLRFLRMIRNIFLIVTVIGCGILIPINVVGGSPFYRQWSNIPTLMRFTPQYIFGTKFWAWVVTAYLMQATVCFFLWWNYRVVFKLRRTYFDSQEYQNSLHSRSLLVSILILRTLHVLMNNSSHTFPLRPALMPALSNSSSAQNRRTTSLEPPLAEMSRTYRNLSKNTTMLCENWRSTSPSTCAIPSVYLLRDLLARSPRVISRSMWAAKWMPSIT